MVFSTWIYSCASALKTDFISVELHQSLASFWLPLPLCNFSHSVLVLCKGVWQDKYVRGCLMEFGVIFSLFMGHSFFKFGHSHKLRSCLCVYVCVSVCVLLVHFFFVLLCFGGKYWEIQT